MYKSPIETLVADIQTQIEKQHEEEIYKAVVSVGINVDKEELIRALQYDRQQYHIGYADGKRDAMDSIVQCENCRDCEMCYPEKHLDREATQAWLCKRYKRFTKPDDFCSYGERREGE